MIKSKHHFVIYPLFQKLTGFLLGRNFKSVKVIGDFNDNGNAILVLSNHISWWDGFWMMHLNLNLLHRRFHFMMLKEQLRKHWYFQYTGAYSVEKNSRSIIESINYSNEILLDCKNMAFMFPQGKIHSLYDEKIPFESGAQRIVNQANDDLQIIFVANLLDYFSDSKPNLYMYLKTSLAKNLKGNTLELEYNRFYSEVLRCQKTKTS